MTYPRSHLVDPEGGVYHVCSRCVRRAFLCGVDAATGVDFEHRKQWLEDRIRALSEIFAIDLYGYAVMSNHYHIVLNLVPGRVQEWTDEEVVERWLALTPRRGAMDTAEARAIRRRSLLGNPGLIATYRDRLGSLSWLMRFINEPLARRANAEDNCTGRFWEGRFKSQRLLDDTAVLACMVYVDLNPVRAGLVDDPCQANHTSLAARLETGSPGATMVALNAPHTTLPMPYRLDQYIELAQWTLDAQRSRRPAGRGPGVQAELWLHHFLPRPHCWQRAIGSVRSLKDYARDLGQCWIRTRSGQLQV